MAAPLDGIRVIEISSWMASPSAGAILSDLGADVIKVEPLEGDPVRGMTRPARRADGLPSVDESFQVDNRGKRSLSVDLGTDAGRRLVHDLVATAQVFLCNLLPQRQARFGLDAETLHGVQPTLVHATLTGYGTEGPEAWRPGFDVTAFFGRGSITDSSAEAGQFPPPPRPAQGDKTTGLALVAGVLASLRLAEQTGEGQTVETSLLHTAVWSVGTELSTVLVDGRQPTRRDRRHQTGALANRFRCADDRYIIVNMAEEHWWPRFCTTMGRTEWIDDPRFVNLKARFEHMPELIDLIDEVFATRTLAEWGEAFDRDGLIWGPAQRLDELPHDPQARAAGVFTEIDHPEVGPIDSIAIPFTIATDGIGPQGAAPLVGQHTGEVLAELGYDADRIAALEADSVIG